MQEQKFNSRCSMNSIAGMSLCERDEREEQKWEKYSLS